MPDYLATADTLCDKFPADMMIFGAHGEKRGDDAHEAPMLSWHDVVDLSSALMAIRDGNMPSAGQNSDRYKINDRLALLAGPISYGAWR